MVSRANERCALIGTIDPDAYSTGEELTDAIDMQDFDRVLFIVMAGTLASTAELDFAVVASETSGGSYAALDNAAITTLTQAGTDSDKQALVEVKAIDVLTAGKRFIKGSMTLTTAGGDAAVVALGFDPHYGPASMYDLASVDEVVNP